MLSSMDDLGVDVANLLTAAEETSPAAAVVAANQELQRALGTGEVRFLIADAGGNALIDHLDNAVRADLNTPRRPARRGATSGSRSTPCSGGRTCR
ncbi:hypothetical protein [Actinotalea sp. Marseille-Q4924]|uniref:hypothetical protein n=1 Tax=Actinotalea sp. Marseille-Q4924 TaxID=2866571 RepID=UPI001CE4043A|nr:hypothetical protein [Actinotalea sp. Marseille-Q4924]